MCPDRIGDREQQMLAEVWHRLSTAGGWSQQMLVHQAGDHPMGPDGPDSLVCVSGEAWGTSYHDTDRSSPSDRQERLGGVLNSGWHATLGEALAQLTGRTAEQGRLAAEMTPLEQAVVQLQQVRSALGQVAVYDGIAQQVPLPTAVEMLARDHEELEERIEGALLLLASGKDGRPEADTVLLDDLIALLRGSKRPADFVDDELG